MPAAAVEGVVAGAAVEGIVAVAALEGVFAVGAVEDIVAVVAVEDSHGHSPFKRWVAGETLRIGCERQARVGAGGTNDEAALRKYFSYR